MRLVARCIRLLFFVWSGYLAYLLTAFVLRRFGVGRNHLESGWLIETFLAIVAIGFVSRPTSELQDRRNVHRGLVDVLFFQVAAFTLYYRVLGVGLLSDDFYLLQEAARHVFGRPTDEHFRPASFLLWGALSNMGPQWTPWLLHVLNVAIHGINGALVYRLGLRLQLRRVIAVLAGLAFLCFPAHVEAVAWASGVQDVLMTCLTLCFLLLLLEIRDETPLTPSVLAVAALAAALFTKETAVCAAPIAIALLWSQGVTTRRAWFVAGAAWLMAMAFAGWRYWLLGSEVNNHPSTTHRGIERFLTGPFATLGFPWTPADASRWPAAALCLCVVVLGLVVYPVAKSRHLRDIQQPILLALCVLAATLPVGRYFLVADDLQNSRYVYLPCAFFVVILGRLFQTLVASGRKATIASGVAASVVLATWVFGAWTHQASWLLAGRTRDQVLAAVDKRLDQSNCSSVAVADLPDTVNGAFVFRNGLAEAIRLQGHNVAVDDAAQLPPDGCLITWRP